VVYNLPQITVEQNHISSKLAELCFELKAKAKAENVVFKVKAKI